MVNDVEDLEIRDITLSEPYARHIATLDAEYDQFWVDATISVINNSKSKTHYILTSVRDIGFDRGSRTLIVSLAESEAERQGPDHRFFPNTRAVLASDTTRLTVALPKHMTQIVVAKAKEVQSETIDLADVTEIRFRIAHSEIDLRPKPTESSVQIAQNIKGWGMPIEKTIKLNLRPIQST